MTGFVVTLSPTTPSSFDLAATPAVLTATMGPVLKGDPGSGISSTDGIPEGFTHLYYTDARAKAAALNLAGQASGLTPLGADSKVPAQYLPGASVAGADKQVQINDGGALGADSGFTYDKAAKILSIFPFGAVHAYAQYTDPANWTRLVSGYSQNAGGLLFGMERSGSGPAQSLTVLSTQHVSIQAAPNNTVRVTDGTSKGWNLLDNAFWGDGGAHMVPWLDNAQDIGVAVGHKLRNVYVAGVVYTPATYFKDNGQTRITGDENGIAAFVSNEDIVKFVNTFNFGSGQTTGIQIQGTNGSIAFTDGNAEQAPLAGISKTATGVLEVHQGIRTAIGGTLGDLKTRTLYSAKLDLSSAANTANSIVFGPHTYDPAFSCNNGVLELLNTTQASYGSLRLGNIYMSGNMAFGYPGSVAFVLDRGNTGAQIWNATETAFADLQCRMMQPVTFTVGTLPSANTLGNGARAHVSDASAPAFGQLVVGGGSVSIPVYSDGTNWKVG